MDRQTDRHAGRWMVKWTEKQKDRKADTWADRQKFGPKDRQTIGAID